MRKKVRKNEAQYYSLNIRIKQKKSFMSGTKLQQEDIKLQFF